MRTLLSQFCEEFEKIVRPVVAPLGRCGEALAEAPEGMPGRIVRPDLQNLAHEMEVLADKVAEQQAYVLIFGPLKSGKSTLMNGLAASYVSEVTSLPAYPCMVYVSHSQTKDYTVRHYNTSMEVFSDPAALHMHVGRAHAELANRIRKAEEADEPFDPPVHFPEAIRRIDVKVPAGHLAQSGAVLVDTPGLYSRMKFGYDRMTREFRNAAACAIFVVKSDNLFLEQVFQEFTELLDLFNRIFLVVNLDTGKRDLGPDGTLVPSLEREDPLRIIEAFENLAMSAPLKKAADDGRLRIYPVDLLRAASQRLQDAQPGHTPTAASDEDIRGQSNFDAFLQDLTDYLNSTDYLVAFLGDSLRRASSLLSETLDLTQHTSVAELSRAADALEAERNAALGRLQAAERLGHKGWNEDFQALELRMDQSVKERSKSIGTKTGMALDGALEAWFKTDASFQSLIQDDLGPLFTGYREELGMHVRRGLEEAVNSGSAGITVRDSDAEDLRLADVDLDSIGRASLDGLDQDSSKKRVSMPLSTDAIPVRKSFWDWLFFRSRTTVRKRILGAGKDASRPIPIETKSARLGDNALEAIRGEIRSFQSKHFTDTQKDLRKNILGRYSSSTLTGIQAALDTQRSALTPQLASMENELKEYRRVLNRLTELRAEAETAVERVDELSAHYGQTDPDLLIQPVESDEKRLPTPAPDEKSLQD